MVTGETAPSRRHARLRDELVDFDTGLDLDGDLGDRLVDEIVYARYPRRHEGRLPSYGAFVSASPAGIAALGRFAGGHLLTQGAFAGDVLRLMADGRRTFIGRGGEGVGLLLFPAAFDRESELVELIGDHREVTAIQRLPNGVVRVVADHRVIVWDGSEWRHKPATPSLVTALAAFAPTFPSRVLPAIVEFCIHYLGPAPCGAIIVWDLGSAEVALGHLRRPLRSLDVPPLSILDALARPALRSFLAQIDGATVLDRDGTMTDAAVHLTFSERAEAATPVVHGRGTRHASARRFSFEEPTTLVFVVSEDGPLSVYRSGRLVGLLDTQALQADRDHTESDSHPLATNAMSPAGVDGWARQRGD